MRLSDDERFKCRQLIQKHLKHGPRFKTPLIDLIRFDMFGRFNFKQVGPNWLEERRSAVWKIIQCEVVEGNIIEQLIGETVQYTLPKESQ